MFRTVFAIGLGACLAALTPAAAQTATDGGVPRATVAATQFDLAIDAAKQSMMSNPSEALGKARKAYQLVSAQDHDAAIDRATAEWLEGEALTRLNRPEEAGPILDRALATVKRVAPRTKLHADLLRSQSTIAALDGAIGRAMQTLQQAHAIYRSLGDSRSQSIVLQNIGAIHADAKDHAQALHYYELAQEAYSEDPMMALAANNNRGNSYKELGRFGEAVAAYRLALESARKIGSPLLEARILTNIASAELLDGQLTRADATIQRGLSLATGEAADWRPFLWGVRAQVRHAQGRDAEARGLLERTFAGQNLAETTLLFRDFHETAYQVYDALGQYDKAVAHLAALKRLDDDARETAASTNFALMNARFDANTQQLRLERSRSDLQRVKHMAAGGVGALLVVIAAIGYALVSAKRSRREIDAANRRLTHAARHDALTGLANRMHARQLLGEGIDRSVAESGCSAVLLIDLDLFKQVNDTHGHAGGDRLLELVSQRLVEIAGDSAVPARLGGDEFAMMLPQGATLSLCQRLAHDTVTALARPFEIFGNTVLIGGSIGFALSPDDGVAVDTLIRNADLALYEAKRRGRGQACPYAPWMAKTAQEAEQMEHALRSALAEGELRLAFQPIVCAETGTEGAREALLRWRHPERGEMEPSEFVALAESSGLITPIGAWVIQEACRAAATWPDHIRVAVNVSVAQLSSPGFVPMVVNALAASGLDPARLELEITESLFLHGESRASETLSQVQKLGVMLSLDDFGTGYSSLSYLQRGVFSRLKIDRSFVQRLARGDTDCQAIVRGIVDLARNFDMETVAEGVESEAHYDLMTALGATHLQGFYIGLPAEKDERVSPLRDVCPITGASAAA